MHEKKVKKLTSVSFAFTHTYTLEKNSGGWGSVAVQNLPSERKLPMGKVQKKVKKTNNSAFSATHTYIILTLVSFFFFFFLSTFPLHTEKINQVRTRSGREEVVHVRDGKQKVLYFRICEFIK